MKNYPGKTTAHLSRLMVRLELVRLCVVVARLRISATIIYLANGSFSPNAIALKLQAMCCSRKRRLSFCPA